MRSPIDINESKNTARLKKLGVKIFIGHQKSNIKNAKIIVVSTAISQRNEELVKGKKMFLPIVHRAEMLGELMRLKQSIAIAGTHGKTTTTSLIAKMIEENGMDPTIINGGIISSLGSNAKLGKGKWMVVEADESDGSFAKLNPTAAIVTNIDLEHLDYHKTEENLETAFLNFLSSIPFYGFVCLCIDHPRTQKLISKLEDKKVITYGLSANADIRATNIIYKNNKTEALDGYNDDLVMSYSILLWIRDTAIRIQSERNELQSSLVGAIGNLNEKTPIVMAKHKPKNNPYEMDIKGEKEDLTWLLG